MKKSKCFENFFSISSDVKAERENDICLKKKI